MYSLYLHNLPETYTHVILPSGIMTLILIKFQVKPGLNPTTAIGLQSTTAVSRLYCIKDVGPLCQLQNNEEPLSKMSIVKECDHHVLQTRINNKYKLRKKERDRKRKQAVYNYC